MVVIGENGVSGDEEERDETVAGNVAWTSGGGESGGGDGCE